MKFITIRTIAEACDRPEPFVRKHLDKQSLPPDKMLKTAGKYMGGMVHNGRRLIEESEGLRWARLHGATEVMIEEALKHAAVRLQNQGSRNFRIMY